MIPFEVVHDTQPAEEKSTTAVTVTERINYLQNCTDKMVIAPSVGAIGAFVAWYLAPLSETGNWLFGLVLVASFCTTIFVSLPVWRSWFSEEGILSGRALLLIALVLGIITNTGIAFSSMASLVSSPFSSVVVWTFFIHVGLYFADDVRNRALRHASLESPRSLEKRGDKVEVSSGQIIPFDAVVVDGAFEVLEHRFGFVQAFALKQTGDEVSSGSTVTVGSGRVTVQGIEDEKEIVPFIEAFETSVRQSSNAIHGRRLRRSLIVMFLLFSGALLGVWLSEAPIPVTLERVAIIFGLAFLLEMETLYMSLRRAFLGVLFRRGVLFRAPFEAIKFLYRVRNVLLDPSIEILAPRVKSIKIVDDRVDYRSLYSSIYCVLAKAKAPKLRDLGRYARTKLESPILLNVEGFRESDNGALATIQGASFVVGDEGFLIDHGVHLDLSEGDSGELLIAIGGAIVASCDFSLPFEENGGAFVDELRRLSITPHLLSSAPQNMLDGLGKNSGVELARIHGGLAGSGYKAIIESHKGALFVGHKETPREAFNSSEFSGALFDTLAFRFDRDHMTLFGSELDSIANALKGVRSFITETICLQIIAAAIATFALGSAVAGISPFGVTLLLWTLMVAWLRFRPVAGT